MIIIHVSSSIASGGQPNDTGLAAQPGREQEFRDSLLDAVEYAKALKCPRYNVCVCVCVGGGGGCVLRGGGGECSRDSLLDAVEYAKALKCPRYNVCVCMEGDGRSRALSRIFCLG